MPSTIESLPQAERQKVIDALLARKPYRKVAAMVGISHVQVGEYYRKVLQPTIQAASKLNAVNALAKTVESQVAETTNLTRTALLADPYLKRIAKHQETIDRSLVAAEANNDGRTVAALISTDLKGLDLDARLTGALDTTQGHTTAIYVMLPNAQFDAEPTQPRGPIVDIRAE